MKKEIGQVFTPENIVDIILYNIGFIKNEKSEIMLKKHIIDNSCGDGAFLTKIVDIYCGRFFINFPQELDSNPTKSLNLKRNILKEELETYIHGIEIDTAVYNQAISNLDNVALKYGITDVKWDIQNGNALDMHQYDGKMDFVVGNPPYVRVHNFDDAISNSLENYKLVKNGMSDLYIAFIELGIRMMNENGVLSYITPNSWLTSIAGNKLRKYLIDNILLSDIIDLSEINPFNNGTYPIIFTLKKGQILEWASYSSFSACEGLNEMGVLSYEDFAIDGKWYLGSIRNIENLRQVKEYKGKKYVTVKNGVATLCDKAFIGNDIPQTEFTIPIVKASRGNQTKCIYPYDKDGKEIPIETILGNPLLAEHYEKYRDLLSKRKTDYDWVYYGRNQALCDTYKHKIAINNLIKDIDTIKLTLAPAGRAVYSGLYILSNPSDIGMIIDIIMNEDFIKYVKSLKKHKANGYYTFSSKDLEQYLNYKISETEKKDERTEVLA